MNLAALEKLSTLARYQILTSTTAASSGHPTSSLSAVELMVGLLFGEVFRYRLDEPSYVNNDRLLFSKGHASPLFYSLWALAGMIDEKELMTLRYFGSRLEGHPTMQFPYTEVPTGSLGQGLSVGVGMALTAKMDKLDFRTFVLLGDSEMAEGSNWEAMQLAAYNKLDNLVGVIDVNRLGQRGETMNGHDVEAYARKCAAFGWEAVVIDGHDLQAVINAYKHAEMVEDRPVMIVAKTLKGKGVSLWEDKEDWHSKQLTGEQLDSALESLGEVESTLSGEVLVPRDIGGVPERDNTAETVTLSFDVKTMAVKKAAGIALEVLGSRYLDMVVLDGEVSNSTHTDLFKSVYPDRFVECFIMEQNMVGAAMGMAKLGKKAVANTFGAFFSRATDQIRMLAQSELNVSLIGSYAGTSVGMDGGSQMALEDISIMRSMWNSIVLYPSDAWSAVRLVELAINYPHLAYIRTTREPTEIIYEESTTFILGGSKTLKSSDSDVATLIGAGITLLECLKAYDQLASQGITVRVIDLYSIKPIDVETLVKACKETQSLIVVEDHYPEGGIAEAVRSALIYETTPIHSLAVRKMPQSGKPEELLAYEEINAAAIVKKIQSLL